MAISRCGKYRHDGGERTDAMWWFMVNNIGTIIIILRALGQCHDIDGSSQVSDRPFFFKQSKTWNLVF